MSSSVWHCDFTKNGLTYSMVWDNKYAASEKGKTTYCIDNFPGNAAFVCGNTQYMVPSGFANGIWDDLGPTGPFNLGSTVSIGLNPILLIATH
jgi:hypothetical protein